MLRRQFLKSLIAFLTVPVAARGGEKVRETYEQTWLSEPRIGPGCVSLAQHVENTNRYDNVLRRRGRQIVWYSFTPTRIGNRKFYKVYTKVVPGIKPYDPKAPAADGWL